MPTQFTYAVRVFPVAAMLAASGCAHESRSRADPSPHTPKESAAMSKTLHATGPFDVSLTPQSDAAGVGDPVVGRMSLDKTFHGDLEATSKGQMLGVRTGVKGSAGYVAMEHVVGTLHGRKGSFTLQHSSTMTRGVPKQSITVVPDSGTDGLEGLEGTMVIEILEGGKHFYHLDYSIDGGVEE